MAVDAVRVPAFDAYPGQNPVADLVVNGSAPSTDAVPFERFSWKEFVTTEDVEQNEVAQVAAAPAAESFVEDLPQAELKKRLGLWATARAMASSTFGNISRIFRLRERTTPAIGGTALGDISDPRVETVGQPEEERFFTASDGRILKFVSYFDGPEHIDLTNKIDAGRKTEYIAHGIWKPDAQGSPIRGNNVQVMAFIDVETGEPVASLRKVHALSWEDVQRLPSFMKFSEEEAFSEGGLKLFEEMAEGRTVVEIAGLWKKRGNPVDVKTALYRFAAHESMDANELWFMGVVDELYGDLNMSYGERVVKTIGETIVVHDNDAGDETTITPILIDPSAAFSELLDDIETAETDGNEIVSLIRRQMLWDQLVGFDWRKLDVGTVGRLEGLLNDRN